MLSWFDCTLNFITIANALAMHEKLMLHGIHLIVGLFTGVDGLQISTNGLAD